MRNVTAATKSASRWQVVRTLPPQYQLNQEQTLPGNSSNHKPPDEDDDVRGDKALYDTRRRVGPDRVAKRNAYGEKPAENTTKDSESVQLNESNLERLHSSLRKLTGVTHMVWGEVQFWEDAEGRKTREIILKDSGEINNSQADESGHKEGQEEEFREPRKKARTSIEVRQPYRRRSVSINSDKQDSLLTALRPANQPPPKFFASKSKLRELGLEGVARQERRRVNLPYNRRITQPLNKHSHVINRTDPRTEPQRSRIDLVSNPIPDYVYPDEPVKWAEAARHNLAPYEVSRNSTSSNPSQFSRQSSTEITLNIRQYSSHLLPNFDKVPKGPAFQRLTSQSTTNKADLRSSNKYSEEDTSLSTYDSDAEVQNSFADTSYDDYMRLHNRRNQPLNTVAAGATPSSRDQIDTHRFLGIHYKSQENAASSTPRESQSSRISYGTYPRPGPTPILESSRVASVNPPSLWTNYQKPENSDWKNSSWMPKDEDPTKPFWDK